MTIAIQNWRSVYPTIAHKSGLDWRLLSMAAKTQGDIPAMVAPEFRCMQTVTYVSLAKLQPGLSYETHSHSDHEEIYYIIGGTGKIKIDDEVAQFRDGDAIYIPRGAMHTITNDGEEMVEFLAFGGYMGADGGRREETANLRIEEADREGSSRSKAPR